MTYDLQMSRDHSKGWNLSIGEPFFLQDIYWFAQAIVPTGPYGYPMLGGEPELLEQLHHHYPDHYIIITNGAKQALSAAYYAYKTKHPEYNSVFHQKPYWPSHPTIAKLAGLLFAATPFKNSYSIQCMTSPNNPDGKIDQGFCHIWDAVYASRLYGYDWKSEKEPEWTIKIESASKSVGLSGLRVGWLITKDKELASHAAAYVEMSTSGVCVAAQRHVAMAMKFVRCHNIDPIHQKAQEVLVNNSNTFKNKISKYTDAMEGLPHNGYGMFAWFRVRDLEKFQHALEVSQVKLVTGEACGEVQPGWFRMSLGHRAQYTHDALTKLEEALND